MNRGRFWIALVVALLVGNAAAMGVLIAKAGDPTPRVLPDYYRKAIAWDETAAARRASTALGWSAKTELSPSSATVVITDATGAAVIGATAEIVARHRSRADQPYTITLDELAPGRYIGDFRPAQAGLYELALTVRRGADTFVAAAVVER